MSLVASAHCEGSDLVHMSHEPILVQALAILAPEEVAVSEEVVEAVAVYSPGENIPVTDPDFVPEGFHENGRNDDGTIKVTDNNAHLYRDVDHLVKMHMEGLWGNTPGVTYSQDSAKCPDGRVPSSSAVNSLSLHEGVNLRGRIVCAEGKVHDADTPLLLEKLSTEPNDPAVIMVPETYQKALTFEERVTLQVPDSITISEEQSLNTRDRVLESLQVPSGEYTQMPSYKTNEDGHTMYALCDEPKCCLMNHAFLGLAAVGMLPPPIQIQTMKYFKERTMYTKEDQVNGNFDVCHRCLTGTACPYGPDE